MIKPEIIRFCAFCNDQFIASKPTATYCSNSCRTKACVKRKQDEQVKADQEAQRQKDQERLQQIADARRLKREQKAESKRQEQEKQAEIAWKAQEAKRIKEDQDAADLAEKNRKEEEDQLKLKEKQEADEKQRLADKETKRILELDLKAKKELADYNRTKAWVEIAFHTIGGISNLISEKQAGHPKPLPLTKPIEKLSLGRSFPPISLNLREAVTKPIEMPQLGYMSLPGINWMPHNNISR